MPSNVILDDAFNRVHEVVTSVLADASPQVLRFRADPAANTVGWLVWHLARVEDAQVAGLEGVEQLWTSAGWADRLALPFDPAATGYGQDAAAVGSVDVDAELLGAYYDAVHIRTLTYLRTLSEADLARVVDTSWDPPVTCAVRLVSTLADVLQHAGQAAYVRGLATRALAQA